MTQARIAREALVVAHNAADAALRLGREGLVVAHHWPEANTALRLVAGPRLVIAISRPHGWDVFDDPPL